VIGLNTTVDLYRPTSAVNSYGESVETLPTGATSSALKCRWTGLSPSDSERVTYQLGSESEVANFRVLFEAGAGVQVWDRLKKGSDYHKVLSVVNVHEMGHHLEVYCGKAEGLT
jgi:hypothetical protein